MYYAWGEVTRTRGVQKVSFRPAAEACGTSGALRYCVYRDRRGTNGDIVYHMHGRNLDERIWNDDTYMTALIQSDWQRRQRAAADRRDLVLWPDLAADPERGEARQRLAERSDGPSASD
jgi:hypothetical protein